MEDDCPESNQPIALTLTGDSTVSGRRHGVYRRYRGFNFVFLHGSKLRADIDEISKLSSFTRKPNSKAARRRTSSKKLETNAADAPAAFHAGRMPSSQFRAISREADDLHMQHGMTWQSSTSQDGDESREGMRTISSGSYGSRVNLTAENGSIFDRMTANNDLGRAILSRWIDPVPEPTAPSASLPLATTFSYPIDFADIQPQHEDDIFGDGVLTDLMAQIEHPTPESIQHQHEPHWNDQELNEIFLELEANGLLDCLNHTNLAPVFEIPLEWSSETVTQSQQPLFEDYQQAPGMAVLNFNELYGLPNSMLDSSISFNSSLSLPLVTPSQSLESLLKESQEQCYTQQIPSFMDHNHEPSQTFPFDTAHDFDWTMDTTVMPMIDNDNTTDPYTQDFSLTKGLQDSQRPFSLDDLGIDWSAIVIPDITGDGGQQEADETYSLTDLFLDQ